MNIDRRSHSGFIGLFRTLPATFWGACLLELLERLAFFGTRAIAPLYLVCSTDRNGLGLSFTQKGIIFSIWALLQCLVPMLAGVLADRHGYRKALVVALAATMLGYLGMARTRTLAALLVEQGWNGSAFWLFLAAACMVGVGTGVFKPTLQGTIAGVIGERTASISWGTFYWVVNVGSALAPMCAAILRADDHWDVVFFVAAAVTGLNLMLALLFYREPTTRDDDRRSAVSKPPPAVSSLLRDRRLVVFLLIFSGFWLMFMQLWDLLPNFIYEWVDTSDVAPVYHRINPDWIQGDQVKPEMIVNINGVSVVLLVLPISWLFRGLHRMAVMTLGMALSVFGLVGCGSSSVGSVCCLMLFLFSLGEMMCIPAFSAYIGLVAPRGQKALYMGYSNVPFAIGWALGNSLGGVLYERLASRVELARRYLVDGLGTAPESVLNEAVLPAEDVLNRLASSLGVDVGAATRILWDRYDPWIIWWLLGGVGLAASMAMVLFYVKYGRRLQDSDGE